jgi:hypothetical protein
MKSLIDFDQNRCLQSVRKVLRTGRDWRCGSSGRGSALQLWSPEFKPQSYPSQPPPPQKKNTRWGRLEDTTPPGQPCKGAGVWLFSSRKWLLPMLPWTRTGWTHQPSHWILLQSLVNAQCASALYGFLPCRHLYNIDTEFVHRKVLGGSDAMPPLTVNSMSFVHWPVWGYNPRVEWALGNLLMLAARERSLNDRV